MSEMTTAAKSMSEVKAKIKALKVLGFQMVRLEANGSFRCDGEIWYLSHAEVSKLGSYYATVGHLGYWWKGVPMAEGTYPGEFRIVLQTT